MNTVSSCSKIEVGGSIAGNNGWMQNLDGWCLLLQGDVTTRCDLGLWDLVMVVVKRKGGYFFGSSGDWWAMCVMTHGPVVEVGVKTSGKKMEVVVDKDEGLSWWDGDEDIGMMWEKLKKKSEDIYDVIEFGEEEINKDYFE
ncbi:hypothetical protein BY996DRAFT_6531717 [Phakopsora pachyrhizi]|uniref:Uncharacterized protein n=1 Tax=Phakopsora pachyrhizi TaxID=170000 RepID=A0AAV0BV02_PHAPC|nr:hypothetical protein BY996DRAFT_6531717 [Phakopsora pachyrhizi]CAH7689429.1 hypothetical protein PPACK8108_LOCUS24506 [Phakopsora pachyrhizi]